MPRLGQHFLKDVRVLRAIVRALDPKPGETIIEIGAGHGELTAELGIKNYELRAIAIEKDRSLAEYLRKKFANSKDVKTIEGDALQAIPSIIHNSSFKIQNYKLTGNLPYYLTGRLLRIIGELERKPTRCVFTLQREVAERICAQPPKMNRLAASVQFWAKPMIVAHVPRTAFRPMPKVDSAVIKLDLGFRIQDLGKRRDAYYETVRALFRQPRKTVVNNALEADRRGLSDSRSGLTRKAIEDRLRRLGLDERARPQDLSVENIIALSRTLRPLS